MQEGQDPQQAIDNLNKSYERRNLRLKKRLKKMLQQKHVYFITFTIAPAHYNYNYDTYLRKIKEALKCASNWLLNSDYGDEGGRLHFHAVAAFPDKLDYSILNEVYQYGAVNFKPIHAKNEKALREYLLKTLNHATKQTSGKIHYSRKK